MYFFHRLSFAINKISHKKIMRKAIAINNNLFPCKNSDQSIKSQPFWVTRRKPIPPSKAEPLHPPRTSKVINYSFAIIIRLITSVMWSGQAHSYFLQLPSYKPFICASKYWDSGHQAGKGWPFKTSSTSFGSNRSLKASPRRSSALGVLAASHKVLKVQALAK